MKRWQHVALAALATVAVTPLYVPEALAFPYRRQVGTATIWSETPISPAIDAIVARAGALVAASPLATYPSGRRVFFTDGGRLGRAARSP